MDINMTLIGQVIAMAVFVWFCMKFVWPMIMGAIEQRQTEITDGLASAEKARADLASAKTRGREADRGGARAGARHRRAGQLARRRHRRAGEDRQRDGAQASARRGARRDRRGDQPRARGAPHAGREDRGRGRRKGTRARDRREGPQRHLEQARERAVDEWPIRARSPARTRKRLFDVANADKKLGPWSDALNAAAAVLGDANAKRVLGNPELDQGKRADFIRAVSVGAQGRGSARRRRKARRCSLARRERSTRECCPRSRRSSMRSRPRPRTGSTRRSSPATAVDAAVAARVKQALEKRLGREVELTLEVDASLIGGAIVRAEDMVIDGSVRTRLEQLARAMVS